MDVATFLTELCDDLTGCGTTSRQLAALEFDADGHDITVRRCAQRRAGYPDLQIIVGGIGRALNAEGVAIGQLRRIIFLDTEISLELVDVDGRARACTWPVAAC